MSRRRQAIVCLGIDLDSTATLRPLPTPLTGTADPNARSPLWEKKELNDPATIS
jgi:hypothetical protein